MRPEPVGRAALAYGLVALLLLAAQAGAICAGRFPDPDDALRLVQVRDWLGGQGWFDLTQHRIDPGDGGVAMHWSRLVDGPLALVMLGLRPLLGAGGAERAALVIVPLVTLGLAMGLVGRMAWARLGPAGGRWSALVLGMSVPVVEQIRPMRIDHHGWQVVAALMAMQAMMARDARKGGWIAGGALAVGLSISIEGLPLAVVFGLAGVVRWWRGGDGRFWLLHYARALAVVSALCFAATRMGDLAQHCDAIAPVHLAVMGFAALALGGVMRARGGWALIGFAAMGAGGLAIYTGLAPQCRAGPFGLLDPLVRGLWYDHVAEGLPVWRQDVPTALQIILPPCAGLGACVALFVRARGEERAWWQDYALILGGALVIAVGVARAGAVAGALAAVPLGWLVARMLARMPGGASDRAPRAGWRRWAGGLGLLVVLMPAAPITLYRLWPHGGGMAAAPRLSACDIGHHAGALAALPRETILAPLDIGPDLLLVTPHSVLATGHHRGARGMHDAIAAFISPPDRARAILRARGIAYLALCPDLGEPQIYARAAPGGLAAALLAGRAPPWLVPVSNRGLMVWRVDHPGAGAKASAAPFMQ